MSDADEAKSGLSLADMWAKYATYTRAASEITRNLCFAGLALIWLLRVPDSGRTTIPLLLQIGALFIIFALLLDLAQYMVGAHRVKRAATDIQDKIRTDPNTVILYPKGHSGPMERLFNSKITCVALAYVFLLWHLGSCVLRGELPLVD